MTKQLGLAWQRWLEPVDEFVRRHGREPNRWAIACTYELEMSALQRSVLPVLSRRGSAFRTLALVDAGVLERVMGEVETPLSGAVNLHAVRVAGGGVFHPKLLFLRAGAHLRICFGSANLTSSGLAGNLELWAHSEDPDLIAGAVAFLDDVLTSKAVLLEPSAKRGIRRALLGLERNRVADVWSSFDGAFAKRLAQSAETKARRAVVLSPLYATARGLDAARRAIRVKDLTLCTDQPVRLEKVDVRTLRLDPTDQEIEDDDRIPTVLHAKAYAFERPDRGAIVWSGSANFTAQALTKSVQQGGNVELMVRTYLPRDEWRRFEQDLLHDLFVVPTGRLVAAPQVRDRMPMARATVLGCELTMGPTGPVLVVHSTRSHGEVILEVAGRTVRVRVRAGRGLVEGAVLKAFLRDVDLARGAATTFAINELVNGELFAVVVNVPHVPPGPDEGGVGKLSLAALAADLLGRVVVFRSRSPVQNEDEDEDEEEDESDDPDGDNDGDGDAPDADVEFEKRLDEVLHQGRLDQEAVTLAVLKKLVRRAPLDQQAQWRTEIARHAEATVAPHLRASVRRMFKLEGA
jgi:hypothetical protein